MPQAQCSSSLATMPLNLNFRRPSTPRTRASSTASCCPAIAGAAVLYCVTCDQPLGSHCIISGAHRDHRLKDLKEAVHDRVKKLNDLSRKLTSKEREFHDVTSKIEAAERKLEEVCNKTQELLQQEYSTLLNLIEQNQQQAFFILNTQKETIRQQLQQLYEDVQNYSSKSTDMSENIKQLTDRQESESPASLLGEINALETSLYTMDEFYSSVKTKLKIDDSRLKALENSVKKIVEKNSELLPRPWEFLETITLDESKKQGNVQFSENMMEMSMSPSDSVTAGSAWSNAWALQSFKKGSHYWEVAVDGCESWVVGVVEESHGRGIRTQTEGHDKNLWILECDGGDLSARHKSDFNRVKETNFQTIGVFLDYDNGQVKFYHVNTCSVIYSFFASFKHAIRPIFRIRAQKETVSRLKICNLIQSDRTVDYVQGQFDNSDISMTSESSSVRSD